MENQAVAEKDFDGQHHHLNNCPRRCTVNLPHIIIRHTGAVNVLA